MRGTVAKRIRKAVAKLRPGDYYERLAKAFGFSGPKRAWQSINPFARVYRYFKREYMKRREFING